MIRRRSYNIPHNTKRRKLGQILTPFQPLNEPLNPFFETIKQWVCQTWDTTDEGIQDVFKATQVYHNKEIIWVEQQNDCQLWADSFVLKKEVWAQNKKTEQLLRLVDEDDPQLQRHEKMVFKILTTQPSQQSTELKWYVIYPHEYRKTVKSDQYQDTPHSEPKRLMNDHFMRACKEMLDFTPFPTCFLIVDGPQFRTSRKILEMNHPKIHASDLYVVNYNSPAKQNCAPLGVNVCYNTHLFEFVRDLDRSNDMVNDLPCFYAIAMDFCSSFARGVSTDPPSCLTMIFRQRMLHPINGVLWMTFSKRSQKDTLEFQVEMVQDFMEKIAHKCGYRRLNMFRWKVYGRVYSIIFQTTGLL